MNPHRGDTQIKVGQETYTLCYDLNACAMVMDKFDLSDFEGLADKALSESGFDLRDFIYILWAGLQRHHSELVEQDVGTLEWDLDTIGKAIADAFQKGLMRKTQPDVEKKVTRRSKTGTGRKPKSGRTRQESSAQTSSGD